MSLFQRIFSRTDRRRSLDPLYRSIVAAARDPVWYRDGRVPDTIDGRFDMVAALTALVLLRLEEGGERYRETNVLLTETFVEDMDSSLRQIGIGDYVVGKHVGRMMSALGGRLTALRGAESLGEAVRRNVFHDDPPSDEAVAFVARRLEQVRAALAARPPEDLLAGMPAP